MDRLDTINSLPPNLDYRSASQTANELIPGLRAQGAEIVVALTHAREPSDVKLAEKTSRGLIDIILGGHDHFYAHQIVNNTHILRSGTDFKQLSYIEAWRTSKSQTGWDFKVTRRNILRSLPEDDAAVELVDKLTSSLKTQLEKPVGYTAVPLDARFTTVRTKESNLGNFVCDLMRHFHSTDCALMASGTIRGDQIYPPGVLLLKDILNCFPFEDPVIVIRIQGSAILQALENSVYLVPALEGRFPQVSNIQFLYDPSRAPSTRVLWVKVGSASLDLEKSYTMATRGYMGRGKDGYTSLLVQSEGGHCEEIVSEENGILISMMMRQYFMSLKVLGKWVRWSQSLHRHWDGVHNHMHTGGRVVAPTTAVGGADVKRHSNGGEDQRANIVRTSTHDGGRVIDSDTEDEKVDGHGTLNSFSSSIYVANADFRSERNMHVARKFTRIWMDIAGIERRDVGMVEGVKKDGLLPRWTHGIAPKLEQRILAEKPLI